MNINGFAGESINNNNADRIQLDKFSILKSCNKPQKIRFFFKKKNQAFWPQNKFFGGEMKEGYFGLKSCFMANVDRNIFEGLR